MYYGGLFHRKSKPMYLERTKSTDLFLLTLMSHDFVSKYTYPWEGHLILDLSKSLPVDTEYIKCTDRMNKVFRFSLYCHSCIKSSPLEQSKSGLIKTGDLLKEFIWNLLWQNTFSSCIYRVKLFLILLLLTWNNYQNWTLLTSR